MRALENSDAVTLGGESAGVTLRSSGRVGFAHPAHVVIRSPAFSVARETDLVGVPEFADEVERLYRVLSGEARLEALEGDFKLSLRAADLGHIDVHCFIGEHHGGPVDYEVTVGFQLDQSYLPPFVRALKAEFGAGVIG